LEQETPKVENKYAELTSEDKKAEIEKIKSTMSEDEIKEAFTIKTETETVTEKKTETPAPEVTKPSESLSPEIEQVAQTLMAQAEEKVKDIYKDFDYSGIKNADGINTLHKVTLMSTIAEVNAKKMATIEKNLKSNDANEDTPTETKAAEFSKPSTSGKVDEKAGEKLFTEMSEKLGLTFDEKEKSE
jgi:hypothetical protein